MPFNELTRTFPLASTTAGQGASIDPDHRPTDPATTANAPDYKSADYKAMETYWQLCEDVMEGTMRLRDRATTYLPRFEAEAIRDYDVRIGMTFVKNRYAQTKEDLVGLVCADPVTVGDDVPDEITALLDDVDGEGTTFADYARTELDKALHFGHAFIYTDYPNASAKRAELGRDLTLADQKQFRLRPYWVLFTARDCYSWRFAKFGGTYVLVQVVLRECTTTQIGAYGVAEKERYRVIKQATATDPAGDVTALGAITFEVYERRDVGANEPGFDLVQEGTIIGPARIPLRAVYGGEKLARFKSKPFLANLAITNVEEAQVQSDYAAVMHKVNVPTPVFIGRAPGENGQLPAIQMGNGIDIPTGGDAKYLEPTGGAIGETRQRLVDIQEHLREQGASLHVDNADAKTAKEIQIAARQRNAKLAKSAESLGDALGGALADMAAFMGIAAPPTGKYDVNVNKDFAEGSFDPFFIAAVRDAFDRGQIPSDVYLYVLKNGTLPDDFDAEDTAALMMAANQARTDAENAAAGNNAPGGATGAGGLDATTTASTTSDAPKPAPAAPRGTATPGAPTPPRGGTNDTPPAASDNDAAQDTALLTAVHALSTQVQALAERIDTAERSAPAPTPAPAPFPPEVLALLLAIAGALANRPGMPPLKITKNADGSSNVEPQPTPAAA